MKDAARLTGRNIRSYRQARGMTLEDLAASIGKSRATVGKYEKGEIALELDTLFDIADALGVTAQQLLPSREPEDQNPAAALEAAGTRFYLYVYDGRPGRIVRGLLICGDDKRNANTPAALFYGVASFSEPQRCRALYMGTADDHDYVTNFLFENQHNKIEHATLCVTRQLEYNGQRMGILSGINVHTMLPAAAKCILSEVPLEEDDHLVDVLTLSRADIRKSRQLNMFMLDQPDAD